MIKRFLCLSVCLLAFTVAASAQQPISDVLMWGYSNQIIGLPGNGQPLTYYTMAGAHAAPDVLSVTFTLQLRDGTAVSLTTTPSSGLALVCFEGVAYSDVVGQPIVAARSEPVFAGARRRR